VRIGPGANSWDSYDRVSKGSLRTRAPRESSSSASRQVDASEKKQNREPYERDKPEFLVQNYDEVVVKKPRFGIAA
jgi:hypothetical protein